ncbi:MAG: hypothetical protein J7L15_05305, partial [Clostridiales bacterium]|nr:hypothetical protein [Clostridiales bacterium]
MKDRRARKEIEILKQEVRLLNLKIQKLAEHLSLYWKTEPSEIVPRWEKYNRVVSINLDGGIKD